MKIRYENPRGPGENPLELRYVRCLRDKHLLGPLSDNKINDCIERTRTRYIEVKPERGNELAQWYVKDNLNNANKKPTYTIGQRFDIQREKYTEIIGKKETQLYELSKETTNLIEENSKLREQIQQLSDRIKECEQECITPANQLNSAASSVEPQGHKRRFFGRIWGK
jgi:predicted nuclease with TOPRIM domain